MPLLFQKRKTIRYFAENLYKLDGYWVNKLRQKGRGFIDKTAENKAGIIKNYILPIWGDINPRKLTVRQIDTVLVNLCGTESGNPLSGSTKNRILTTLSDIYEFIQEEDRSVENVAKTVSRYSTAIINKRGRLSDPETAALFPEDHDSLLKIWGNQLYAVAFLILFDAGLRPGELLALKWGDWYPDIRFFSITKAIEAGTKNKIKGTKTGSIRPALVSAQAADEINRLFEKMDHVPDRFIFSEKGNIPIEGHRLTYNFSKAIERAGLNRSDYTPYWLRHTFNTNMLTCLDDEDVRELMGHVTKEMTMNYNHPDLFILLKKAKRLRRILDQNIKDQEAAI